MRNLRGSALILAMFFLVLFSGIGMYVVSLPVPVGDSPREYHRAAVSRNMAEAGVHAAIARFPGVIPENAPVERRFPVGPGNFGRYKVSSNKTGGALRGSLPGDGSAYEEYIVLSEGDVPGAPGGLFRVRALIRYGPIHAGARKRGGGKPSPLPRARIVEWTGSPGR